MIALAPALTVDDNSSKNNRVTSHLPDASRTLPAKTKSQFVKPKLLSLFEKRTVDPRLIGVWNKSLRIVDLEILKKMKKNAVLKEDSFRTLSKFLPDFRTLRANIDELKNEDEYLCQQAYPQIKLLFEDYLSNINLITENIYRDLSFHFDNDQKKELTERIQSLSESLRELHQAIPIEDISLNSKNEIFYQKLNQINSNHRDLVNYIVKNSYEQDYENRIELLQSQTVLNLTKFKNIDELELQNYPPSNLKNILLNINLKLLVAEDVALSEKKSKLERKALLKGLENIQEALENFPEDEELIYSGALHLKHCFKNEMENILGVSQVNNEMKLEVLSDLIKLQRFDFNSDNPLQGLFSILNNIDDDQIITLLADDIVLKGFLESGEGGEFIHQLSELRETVNNSFENWLFIGASQRKKSLTKSREQFEKMQARLDNIIKQSGNYVRSLNFERLSDYLPKKIDELQYSNLGLFIQSLESLKNTLEIQLEDGKIRNFLKNRLPKLIEASNQKLPGAYIPDDVSPDRCNNISGFGKYIEELKKLSLEKFLVKETSDEILRTKQVLKHRDQNLELLVYNPKQINQWFSKLVFNASLIDNENPNSLVWEGVGFFKLKQVLSSMQESVKQLFEYAKPEFEVENSREHEISKLSKLDEFMNEASKVSGYFEFGQSVAERILSPMFKSNMWIKSNKVQKQLINSGFRTGLNYRSEMIIPGLMEIKHKPEDVFLNRYEQNIKDNVEVAFGPIRIYGAPIIQGDKKSFLILNIGHNKKADLQIIDLEQALRNLLTYYSKFKKNAIEKAGGDQKKAEKIIQEFRSQNKHLFL